LVRKDAGKGKNPMPLSSMLMMNPLKTERMMWESMMKGQDPRAAMRESMDPDKNLSEDGKFWSTLGSAFIKPYQKAIDEGKPMEAVGRGAFEVATLLLGGAEAKAGKVATEGATVAKTVGKVGEGASKTGKVTNVVSKSGKAAEMASTAGKASEAANVAGKTKVAGKTANVAEVKVAGKTANVAEVKVAGKAEKVSEVASTAGKATEVANVGGKIEKTAKTASTTDKVTDVASDASRTAQSTAEAGVVKANNDYGVAFFGESNLKYYTGDTAKLGREGGSFFHMPIEDSSIIRNSADAARYTGMSPSTLKAYVEGGETYGISFPSNRFETRVPTAADAGGWPHFLEGGKTAVALEGENTGYLLNPVREFVLPGGAEVPKASVLFKLGPNGSWIPLRRF
jgi:hypothetical protein